MDTSELMQKVAEVAPKHYQFLLKTAGEIRESPFKDEILEDLDGLMKKAFNMPAFMTGDTARSVGGGAAAVGGAVAAGIAYALAGDMYDAAKRGITKSRNYKNMMDANPELRKRPAKDVQKAFSVLQKLNPEFAGEPTIAGAWVGKQSLFGDEGFADVNQLKGLIDSRKGLTESKRLPQVPKVPGMGEGGPKGLSKKDLEGVTRGLGDVGGRVERIGRNQDLHQQRLQQHLDELKGLGDAAWQTYYKNKNQP